MSSNAAHAGSELPDIDDRLVAPKTRYEMYDGGLVYVSPADPPHGEQHLQLAALIEAHTGLDFEAAADLLTRTSKVDDIAPDVSVYPDAPDPRTGGRQLEQLAFEIVSTQSLGRAAVKAAKLAARGCAACSRSTSSGRASWSGRQRSAPGASSIRRATSLIPRSRWRCRSRR